VKEKERNSFIDV